MMEAIEWIAQRSPEQVGHMSLVVGFAEPLHIEEVDEERERIIAQIEKMAEEIKNTGQLKAWFSKADRGVKKVRRHVTWSANLRRCFC